tara:strand:+ start:705 stop:1829 length:1125 start_codon:yes stop_codon:yes gene_type:complete
MNTKYGLICLSKILQQEDASLNSFKGLSRKNFSELSSSEGEGKALSVLSQDILHNIDLSIRIIDFCRDNGIDHYRLNTSIFGIVSDPTFDVNISDLPNFDQIEEGFRSIGRTSITKGVSLSIQPDKFCRLIDDDDSVVERSIQELNFYSWFFDKLGAQENISSPILLHLNSQPTKDDHDSYCDFVDRFFENYKKLDGHTQSRLVLKNADNGSWNAFGLFKYLHVYCYEEHDFGFPLAYNNLFDSLNPSDISGATVEQQVNVGAFHETWKGVVPVFTWSESKQPGSRSHARELSQHIPDFGYQIKWEVDVTDKDIAILKLLGPDAPSRISAEELAKISRGKYRKVENNYNALYESARRSTIVSQDGDVKFFDAEK